MPLPAVSIWQGLLCHHEGNNFVGIFIQYPVKVKGSDIATLEKCYLANVGACYGAVGLDMGKK